VRKLLLFILALWLSRAGAAHAAQAERWNFIITCDSRGAIQTGVNDVILTEIVREILRWDVDFVIYAGDLVYGAGVPPAQFETQLWHWVSLTRPLYDAGIGVYVCRGNHEQGDTWYTDPNEPPNPVDNYALRWLHVFGSDKHLDVRLPDNGPAGEKYMTYAVVHKNALVLALDEYAGTWHHAVHAVNQEWLDSQLQVNTKPHIFAFGHEPAFRTYHQDCLDAHPDQRDAFWRSLRAAGAGLYTCGHDHYYDNARVHDNDGSGDPNHDVHQLIVATAGAPLYSWSLPYRGQNSDFQLSQLFHSEHWGYILVEVNGLDVTTTWMERQGTSTAQSGVYKAKFVWSYAAAAGPVVLQPNGGEQVLAGQSYTIRWRVVEGTPVARVALGYSPDGGATWTLLAEVDNTGSYVWLVPPVISHTCLIKVADVLAPSQADTSDKPFSIVIKQTETAATDAARPDPADLSLPASE
jgi:hypothetical protein